MHSAHFTNMIRKYLENALGVPCLTKEHRPCELTLHPANFGFRHANLLRLSVMCCGYENHALLSIRHNDRFRGSYAALSYVCSRLQSVLDDEAPTCAIRITEDYHLHLTIEAVLERPDDVAGAILLAFRLLLKYENAICEEMNLLPDEEIEPDEDDQENHHSYYVPPRRPHRRTSAASAETENPFDPDGDDEDETVF